MKKREEFTPVPREAEEAVDVEKRQDGDEPAPGVFCGGFRFACELLILFSSGRRRFLWQSLWRVWLRLRRLHSLESAFHAGNINGGKFRTTDVTRRANCAIDLARIYLALD